MLAFRDNFAPDWCNDVLTQAHRELCIDEELYLKFCMVFNQKSKNIMQLKHERLTKHYWEWTSIENPHLPISDENVVLFDHVIIDSDVQFVEVSQALENYIQSKVFDDVDIKEAIDACGWSTEDVTPTAMAVDFNIVIQAVATDHDQQPDVVMEVQQQTLEDEDSDSDDEMPPLEPEPPFQLYPFLNTLDGQFTNPFRYCTLGQCQILKSIINHLIQNLVEEQMFTSIIRYDYKRTVLSIYRMAVEYSKLRHQYDSAAWSPPSFNQAALPFGIRIQTHMNSLCEFLERLPINLEFVLGIYEHPS